MRLIREAIKRETTVAILVFSGTFAIYLLTLSKSYWPDGIGFANWLEHPSRCLLANHILYPLVPFYFYRAWELFGWTGRSLFPLQVFSALGGAVAVLLVYKISTTIIESRRPALWLAVGFGASAGIWSWSVDAESTTMPLAINLALLYLLLRNSAPSRTWSPVLLGVLCAISITSYQTSVLIVPAMLVGYMMGRGLERNTRVRQSILFTLVTGVISVSIFVCVAVTTCGVRSWQSLLRWQFAYSGYGMWGKPSLRGMVQGLSALQRSVVGYPGTGEAALSTWIRDASVGQRLAWAFLAAVVFVAFAASIVAAIKARNSMGPAEVRALAVITTWGVINSAFALYWVPGDITFWVSTLTSWWLAIAILISARRPLEGRPSSRIGSPRYQVILACGVILIATTNFLFSIYPKTKPDCTYQIVQAVKERTTSDDLVLTPGADYLLTRELGYFAHRKTISILEWVVFSNKDPREVADARFDEEVTQHRESKEEVLEKIDAIADEFRNQGGRVYLVGAHPGKPEQWTYLDQQTGFTKNDFSHFRGNTVWTVCGEEILEIE